VRKGECESINQSINQSIKPECIYVSAIPICKKRKVSQIVVCEFAVRVHHASAISFGSSHHSAKNVTPIKIQKLPKEEKNK
jgi:hypothetical protein